ncbi:alpha/beta fold hydrolase [Devosia sp.]|uniref:alpha/beta fold hydrolase n=1 Tax=Devosia sp. TaxID=1871048 RepID=UPI003BAC3AAE
MQFLTTPDGFRLAYYELAEGEGRPIVLQHGFSASTASEWVECGIAARLGELGRPVVGIDALGHGKSDAPHESRHYGERRMARDIGVLLDEIGAEEADLVGYSMGAIVTLIAATHERRLRRVVAGGVGEAVVLLGGVDTRALDNGVLEQALRADDPGDVPEMVRGFRQWIDQNGSDRLALAAHASAINTAPIALDTITAPTLIIAGRSDPLAINPDVLVAAIPGAWLALVDGDHTSARLNPQFVSEIAAFLA